MCSWEDDSAEAWEHSTPNGQSLLDAQRHFLADGRPFRRREGRVRPPRTKEAREADWQPIEPTNELLRRAEQSRRDFLRELEDPFQGYASEIAALHERASELSHLEVKDESYYVGHPIRTGWWMVRYARPGTIRRRWTEVRTGTITFAA